jgi:hypothetical protein
MTSARSIRAARVDLALALMEAGDRLSEAAHELWKALDEPGGDPADWEIHRHLAALAERQDDPNTALRETLAATLEAPPQAADELARWALDLLEGRGESQRAAGLDASQVRELGSRAGDRDTPASLVQLALRMLLLRGEEDAARSVLTSPSGASLPASPAIGAAQAVTRALRLIDEGSFTSAVAVLEEAGVTDDDPAGAATRALALYGADRLDEAYAAAEAAPDTFDAAVVQALVWLARAARGDGDTADLVDPSAEADRAASAAARIEPSLGDGLLLRAQVALEALEDLDGGRQLLHKALRRLEKRPERARLWRVQQMVRDDGPFRYTRLEMAAACERWEELLEIRVHELPFIGTSDRQAAASAERIAEAQLAAARAEASAAFYGAAAQFYANFGERAGALRARQLAFSAHPTPDGGLALAEECWLASYAPVHEASGARERDIDDGLLALDRIDSDGLRPEPVERVKGAYLRGLLLARRVELSRDDLPDTWGPLPWLLVAALDDPGHSYRAAWLAWSLNTAGLHRPALHFAERAFALEEDDTWIQECLIVAHMNWYGALDHGVQGLLDNIGDPEWSAATRMVDALHRNDLPAAERELERATFDAPWAREARAEIIAQLHGFDAAEPLLRSLMEEHAAAADYQSAADFALMVRDPSSARQYLESGVSARVVGGPRADFASALLDLIADQDGALDTLLRQIAAAVRPFLTLEWSRRTLPVMVKAWKDDARLAERLDVLRRAADARVYEAPAAPPLAIEIERARVTSTDPAVDAVVRSLLYAEERRGSAAVDLLRQLAADPAVPPGLSDVLAIADAPHASVAPHVAD